ncbi:MAG: tetratricopeptide repeat protein [Pseudomonadota bacterium]
MTLRALALLAVGLAAGLATGLAAAQSAPDQLAALRQALAASPADARRVADLAMYQHAHERLAEAIKLYTRGAELEPAEPRWPYLKAVALEESGQLAAAIPNYDQAFARSGGEVAAAGLRLARAQAVAGDAAAARRLLEQLRDDPGVGTAAAGELGLLLLAAGQAQAARQQLEQALAAQPAASRLYHALAAARRQAGDVAGAREALRQAGAGAARFADPLVDEMRRWSQSYSFYMSQGLLAARSGDLKAARSLLQRAYDANPDSPEVMVNLARVLESAGELSEAEALLETLIQTQPTHAPGWFNRGVLHELAQDDAAALTHYEKALEHDPRLFQAELLAAAAALRLKRYPAAARHYGAASALRPERDGLLVQLAVAQWMVECATAVQTALKLVRRRPEDPAALTLYIRLAATCPAAGLEARQNALNASRNLQRLADSPEMALNRAMAEAAVGNYAAAQAQHEAALAQLTSLPEASRQRLAQLGSRYLEGLPADQPFILNEQVLLPRRLTAADRR